MWEPADAAALHAILGDPLTMHAWAQPYDREGVEGWIARGAAEFARRRTGRWALVQREDGVLIGDAGLVPTMAGGHSVLDLGYIVHHPYWRQGYGFEAATALVRYAFETLEAPAVHAHMALDNTASWSLAEKLGMTHIDEFPFERDRGKTHRLYELKRLLR